MIYKNYIIDDMQVQKENKYIELIETLKNRYASPDNFIENMNTIKDTKGIDVAINKLQEKKALFDNSDAIINQVENYELKP